LVSFCHGSRLACALSCLRLVPCVRARRSSRAAGVVAAAPWGRGAGEGIGLSGHKNEYKAGVRVGNWVEEQISAEAIGKGDTLKVRERWSRGMLWRASSPPPP
jgi:hypothetical protein